MRLLDLNPKLDDHLRFDCPLCGEHKIRIPVAAEPSDKAWGCVGTVENATVLPSIRHEAVTGGLGNARRCVWHGYIKNGAIETLGDSKNEPLQPTSTT